MRCVVADSGPLIALAKLNCLNLPQALWGKLVVPQTVLDECTGLLQKRGATLIREAVDGGLVDVMADMTLDKDILDYGLDPGEAQAIALASHLRAVLLIDEQRGRRSAFLLEIPHIGTCGLLVRAKQKGLIEQVGPLLDKLRAEDYFLSAALVRDTLRLVQEL